jgi:hypothetical protein
MNFVALPDDVKIGILALVGSALGLAFMWITAYVPWVGDFLNKYKEEWTAVLGYALIDLLENA